MKSKSLVAMAAAIVALMVSQIAGAHPNVFHVGGFAAGIAHPFLGLDHVLAMIAVGVWAAQCGGRARIVLPAAFVAAIAAGGVLALIGVVLPHVEAGIAATVLALGLLIALAVRLPSLFGAALAAVFALWHGYAHGIELPATAFAPAYAAGFVLASSALVVAGVLAGRWTIATPRVARALGACVATAGLLMLASA
jgi:urease accessory protein